MATAAEYGFIAAGISAAIIAVTLATGGNLTNPRWDDNADKKTAAAACAARPASNTGNVVITDWLNKQAEYKCPALPLINYPSFVRYWRAE